jgi:hypothetical protein
MLPSTVGLMRAPLVGLLDVVDRPTLVGCRLASGPYFTSPVVPASNGRHQPSDTARAGIASRRAVESGICPAAPTRYLDDRDGANAQSRQVRDPRRLLPSLSPRALATERLATASPSRSSAGPVSAPSIRIIMRGISLSFQEQFYRRAPQGVGSLLN